MHAMFSSFLRGCSRRTAATNPRFLPSSRLARTFTSTIPKTRPAPVNAKLPARNAAARPASAGVGAAPIPIPSNVLQARNKAALLEQIFNAGREEIYRAPSHVGLIFAAWTVFASGTLCILYFVNSGFLDTEEMKRRGLPWWVPPVYKFVILFMGFCSGLFLAQSFYFISAIRIVKDGGALKLLISQRPWFPMWRHHKFLVEPHQLSVDRRVVYIASQPGGGRTEVGQQAWNAREEGGLLKRMVVSPFLIMRKLFFHEGVLKVVIPGGKNGDKERWVRLDLDGKWSNHGKDLLDIAVIRS